MSLEESLHLTHDRFMLVADVFELRSMAPGYLSCEVPSSAASRALTETCRQAGLELRMLLDQLPVEMKNWAPIGRGKPAK